MRIFFLIWGKINLVFHPVKQKIYPTLKTAILKRMIIHIFNERIIPVHVSQHNISAMFTAEKHFKTTCVLQPLNPMAVHVYKHNISTPMINLAQLRSLVDAVLTFSVKSVASRSKSVLAYSQSSFQSTRVKVLRIP